MREKLSESNQIFWLALMRMRPPLLLLVSVYSLSVLGMVLMPGPEQNGVVTNLSFFHAIYFVSYISTTIGLGEIPYEFSAAQRLWSIFIMYMTVVVWIYAIGTILALIQDPAYRHILEKKRFAKSIARLHEPFYIICGYGETGRYLTEVFTRFHIRVVVIDNQPEKINHLILNDTIHQLYIPRLCADACATENLIIAGLQHPMCSHLIAVTSTDESNLKIAITSKLQNPDVKTVCCANYPETKLNMESFGTDYIIDSIHVCSDLLTLALQAPDSYILRSWLSGMPQRHFHWPRRPPHGLWVVCGYGRLGKRIVQTLIELKLPAIVVDSNPDSAQPACPVPFICATGIDAKILREAKIKEAVGLIAGTDNDVNNLSIIMTAKELNANLFVLARQNQHVNTSLFVALDADLTLYPSEILSHQIRTHLTMPLLHTFFNALGQLGEEQVLTLLRYLAQHFDNARTPDIWSVKINNRDSYAIYQAIEDGQEIQIKHLLPNLESSAPCVPLLLQRDDLCFPLPDKSLHLEISDKLLFCGLPGAYSYMRYLLSDVKGLQIVKNNLPKVTSTVLHALFNGKSSS